MMLVQNWVKLYNLHDDLWQEVNGKKKKRKKPTSFPDYILSYFCYYMGKHTDLHKDSSVQVTELIQPAKKQPTAFIKERANLTEILIWPCGWNKIISVGWME